MLNKDTEDEVIKSSFGRLTRAAWTLLLDGVFMDNTGDILVSLRDHGTASSAASMILFFVFIVMSAVTVMNMIVGILIQVISDEERRRHNEGDVNLTKTSILAELNKFDCNGNGLISRDELEAVMASPAAVTTLQELHVDVDCIA